MRYGFLHSVIVPWSVWLIRPEKKAWGNTCLPFSKEAPTPSNPDTMRTFQGHLPFHDVSSIDHVGCWLLWSSWMLCIGHWKRGKQTAGKEFPASTVMETAGKESRGFACAFDLTGVLNATAIDTRRQLLGRVTTQRDCSYNEYQSLHGARASIDSHVLAASDFNYWMRIWKEEACSFWSTSSSLPTK